MRKRFPREEYSRINTMANLVNQLKQCRTARRWTQGALAGRVSVTRQTIIAAEKAKYIPSAKLVLELASALEVPVAELLWLVENADGSY